MNETIAELDIRFEQFYAANFPRVKNFAKLLTKSEEDAEDIAAVLRSSKANRWAFRSG